MSVLSVSHSSKKINTRIALPGSKSESNRLLILNALSGNKIDIKNISGAHDSQRLKQILESSDTTADVMDAGTSMRFLTACYCVLNQPKIITGGERMKQRPIAPLVNALSEIGFDVRYLEKEGFPPVEIHPIKMEKLDNETFIEGNISSQFITALLLIAPFLPGGLKINFTTQLVSRPYIEMTLKIFDALNIPYQFTDEYIQVAPCSVNNAAYTVSADWSSASYWYSMAFLADEAEILLEGLQDNWVQGDRVMADWMKRFGIVTDFVDKGALVRKTIVDYPRMMKLNFRDNPDLAQTFAVMFAASGIYATFSGIESLKIKETDRVAALKNELLKLGIHFDYSDMYEFYQLKGNLHFDGSPIKTYNDHRMAMSFAPLGLIQEIGIEDANVVEKSYPTFWSDMQKAGFNIKGV
jgi:3-phosphoshikimate 1-carboxyvinyltransferase